MATEKQLKEKINFAILLEGTFTPSILQPYWFKEKKIFTERDLAEVRVNILSEQITELESTFYTLKASKNQLFVEAQNINFLEILLHTVRGIFLFLSEYPVSSVEFITDLHYNLRDSSGRDQIFQKISNYAIFNNTMNQPKTSYIEVSNIVDESLERKIQVSKCLSNPNHIQLYGRSHYDLKKIYHDEVRTEVLPDFLNMEKVEKNINFAIETFLNILNPENIHPTLVIEGSY